jgi:hypothetical protein
VKDSSFLLNAARKLDHYSVGSKRQALDIFSVNIGRVPNSNHISDRRLIKNIFTNSRFNLTSCEFSEFSFHSQKFCLLCISPS